MSGASRRRRPSPKVVYSRELPGGGYVTIQTETRGDSSCHGWISVERRSDRNRRDGTVVPVIAELTGKSPDDIVDSLRAIASDNVAVARAIQRWERGRGG